MKILSQLFQILFPSRCLFCRTLTQDDPMLCNACWTTLEFITEPKCHTCSLPFHFDVGASNLCAACLTQKPFFDAAFALLKYNTRSKIIVHKLKYGDQLHLAHFFAKLINARLSNEISDYHMVMPVPMHRKRLVNRRYNQAAVLGSNIAKLTDIPFVANALVKTRYDMQQTKLSRDERLKNVLNSFALAPGRKNSVHGKHIILVDDVYTTGTTLNECSKILKSAGCAKVYVITLAKVIL